MYTVFIEYKDNALKIGSYDTDLEAQKAMLNAAGAFPNNIRITVYHKCQETRCMVGDLK